MRTPAVILAVIVLLLLSIGGLVVLRDRTEARTRLAQATSTRVEPRSVQSTTAASPSVTPTASSMVSPSPAEDVDACKAAMAVIECRTANRGRSSACAGGTPPWRTLLDSARRGHVPSMTRFVMVALPTRYNEDSWDLEAAAAYRDHAFAFLTRAAEAGDGTAVRKLAQEHLSPGFGTRAVPYDRVRGLAYARLLLRLADPNWRSRLDREMMNDVTVEAEEVARADALAPTLLPPVAMTRLQGWSPARDFAELGYGCSG